MTPFAFRVLSVAAGALLAYGAVAAVTLAVMSVLRRRLARAVKSVSAAQAESLRAQAASWLDGAANALRAADRPPVPASAERLRDALERMGVRDGAVVGGLMGPSGPLRATVRDLRVEWDPRAEDVAVRYRVEVG